MQKNYDDIIDLPHHQSARHAHMTMIARAAQFAPFAALTGFDDDIEEMAGEKLGRYDSLGRLRADVDTWEDPC
ncbi:MAG: hypothetical protein IJS22_09330 [Lachnospiraceae bacterium]|nr:hypothetical protein [Lachnospiraceae bacterium]